MPHKETRYDAPQYACPKCAGTNLTVLVEQWAVLRQDSILGNIETETYADGCLDHSHFWTENSAMQCSDCAHADIADNFELTP